MENENNTEIIKNIIKKQEEENTRLSNELITEKIKNKKVKINNLIVITAFVFIIFLSLILMYAYKTDFNKEAEKINETLLKTEQIQEAYNIGARGVSLNLLNQIINNLNTKGYFEMDLPIGNNQTQKFKLGIIK